MTTKPVTAPTVSTSLVRRQSRSTNAEMRSAVNAAIETNATVELSGRTTTDTTPSHHIGSFRSGRSVRSAIVSTTSAQNPSQVYCFKSFRVSANGASIVTTATTVAAKRARGLDVQGSPRANTYAMTTVSAENMTTIKRAR